MSGATSGRRWGELVPSLSAIGEATVATVEGVARLQASRYGVHRSVKIEELGTLRRPDCSACVDGWVCEEHQNRWCPHEGCAAGGVPCAAPGCAAKALAAQHRQYTRP